MSGILYNPEVEQTILGIDSSQFWSDLKDVQDFLNDGWHVVTFSSVQGGSDGYFVILLERRKSS